MSDLSYDASYGTHSHGYLHKSAGSALFGFVVLILLIFMALVFFRPCWILRSRDCETTCEVDWFKALLAAFVIAIVIGFIIWLIAAAFC